MRNMIARRDGSSDHSQDIAAHLDLVDRAAVCPFGAKLDIVVARHDGAADVAPHRGVGTNELVVLQLNVVHVPSKDEGANHLPKRKKWYRE